jgi:hypothetical protein
MDGLQNLIPSVGVDQNMASPVPPKKYHLRLSPKKHASRRSDVDTTMESPKMPVSQRSRVDKKSVPRRTSAKENGKVKSSPSPRKRKPSGKAMKIKE